MTDPFIRALTGDEEHQSVTLVRRYETSIDDLWRALTDPDRIARWYGAIVGPVPRGAGDGFQVDIGGGTVRRARLEACDAPRILEYTWWSGDDDPGLVRLRLEPAGDATELTVHHDRLRPHRLVGYGAGWEGNLATLAAVVGAAADEADATARAARWELLRSRPLELAVEIDAPVARVWEAWGSADGLAGWWWTHWDDVRIAADVRVGGAYRIEAPRVGMSVTGRFVDVEPERRLAFTWVWSDADGVSRDEAVDVAFAASGNGTRLIVRHTGPWADDAPAESYRQGWEFVLGELARSVASAP
jgi:uncharacterized protein YndB with AHSA1/START domain